MCTFTVYPIFIYITALKMNKNNVGANCTDEDPKTLYWSILIQIKKGVFFFILRRLE